MADRMHILDTGLPDFSRYSTTEDKLAALIEYLYMMIEELRYLLRHLDADNFADDSVTVIQQIAAAAAGASAVLPDLYAKYGTTAAISVWRLCTDWRRARNFQREDQRDISYIDIHDDEIDLITESVAEPVRTEQLKQGGACLWWAEEAQRTMSTSQSPWPVMVYVYDEKARAVIHQEAGALSIQTGDSAILLDETGVTAAQEGASATLGAGTLTVMLGDDSVTMSEGTLAVQTGDNAFTLEDGNGLALQTGNDSVTVEEGAVVIQQGTDSVTMAESDVVFSLGGETYKLSEYVDARWFTAHTVAAGDNAVILTISDAAITADHVLARIEFADPAYITTGYNWATASGSFTLTGTATAATTANVLLVRKSNRGVI